MGQHLPVIDSRTAIRAFERAGWMVLPRRGKGSHTVMGKPGATIVLVVPEHDPIRRGTLRSLIRDAGLSVDAFRALL